MAIKSPRISRRRLLAGSAATMTMLPWLRPSRVRAGGETNPTPRLVFVFSGNDAMGRDSWATAAAGQKADLPAELPGWLSPLQAHREKITVVGDLDDPVRMNPSAPNQGVGHERTVTALTGQRIAESGWSEGISLDQFVGERLGVSPLTLGLAVGEEKNDNKNRISYDADGLPVAPYYHPLEAFVSVFGDGVGMSPEQIEQRLARRQSILDVVAGEFSRGRSSLAAEDRIKLDHHATLLRELEEKFAAGLQEGCNPLQPDVSADYNHLANANYARNFELHADILTQAFACDITRVGTIMMHNSGNGDSNAVWPEEGLDYPYMQHGINHAYFGEFDTGAGADALNGLSFAERSQIRLDLERFLMRRFAYLVAKLDATPEPDGSGTSMLDNSIVVWVKCMAQYHQVKGLPHVIAGGAAGRLNTGRFISGNNGSTNDLLLSLCHLMGFDDVESFGRPEYCNGPLDLS